MKTEEMEESKNKTENDVQEVIIKGGRYECKK